MKTAVRELLATQYPFSTSMDVRLTDLDFAQHVNNAAVAGFHEEVRVRFHVRYFGMDSVFEGRVGGGVVAHVSIQYLREMMYGKPVIGCAGIEQLGNSSYIMIQALYQGEFCVGEATCVIAQRDQGRAQPLSTELRTHLGTLIVPRPA